MPGKQQSKARSSAEQRAQELTERMLGACLGLRARLVSRAITQRFEEEFRSSGVSGPQFFLLASISHLGPIARSRLADVLAMQRSTLHRNLESLEQQGWIELGKAAGTRGWVVRLLPAGRRKLLVLEKAWERGQAGAEALLGEQAAKALSDLGSQLLQRPERR